MRPIFNQDHNLPKYGPHQRRHRRRHRRCRRRYVVELSKTRFNLNQVLCFWFAFNSHARQS